MDNKKTKEKRDQKITLVLTKTEKEQIQTLADEDNRSLTQFLIKKLYEFGILKKNTNNS